MVDDTEGTRYAVVRALKSAGYEMYEAANGKDALRMVDEIRPQLVTLDIHLPDKSGINLLEFVHENYRQIIVFMMTNQATDHYRAVCAQLGAQRFFDKATEFENLTEAMSL